jgi:UDP-N-acetylglucosamine--N-acetylmuramyl-(pentapeptide) pyrophosphoryl-undecaprenol N-acetylglucosamine transferase
MSRILFAGGGTLGPVTPLLAVADRLRETDDALKCFWVGTDSGPERTLVEANGIPFTSIPIAKLPRYLTPKLFTLPFDWVKARKAAAQLLDTLRPNAIVAAGGFTAVPVIQEAYHRRIPCLTHQLDAQPLLSNRLVVRHCRYVTTSFPYDRNPFPHAQAMYQVPTPVRFMPEDLPSRTAACLFFGFDPSKPVLFVIGGGTGSIALNEALWRIENVLPEDVQIIHSTGRGKGMAFEATRGAYAQQEFFDGDQLRLAYAASDLIVSRAGFGTISECAALSKPMILIPLPDSPQLKNVSELDGCVVPVYQTKSIQTMLRRMITTLLEDDGLRKDFGSHLHDRIPTDRGEALAHLVRSMMV